VLHVADVRPRLSWRTAGAWLALLAAIAAAAWFLQRGLPVLVARETLGLGDAVTIGNTTDDGGFFGEGWLPPVTVGAARVRVATGAVSTVDIPLPRADEYTMTIRIDPVPRPLDDEAPTPTVRVAFNGTPVLDIAVQWTPGRIGAYDLAIPRALARSGTNRLTLVLASPTPGTASGGRRPSPGLSDGSAFALWYVRVRPPIVSAK
jgi:hypothetical protein